MEMLLVKRGTHEILISQIAYICIVMKSSSSWPTLALVNASCIVPEIWGRKGEESPWKILWKQQP